MKTKTFKYFKLLLFAIALTNFAACDVNDEDDYYTDKLCRYAWRDEWYDGIFYNRQELRFYTDGTGTDYYFDGINGSTVTFYWHWENYQRNIVISYNPNSISYFDDVHISNSILSGYLDGNYVEFEAW